MKLDFNKIVFSIIFSVIPVHIFMSRMQLDISFISLFFSALVIEIFVVFIAEPKNKYVRIAALVLALICVFIFNDIDAIKLGLDELLDSYGSLVRVKKDGNDILGDLVVDCENIGYLIRLYLEISITCLYFVYGNRLWKIIYIDITIPFIILIFATGITPELAEMCMIIIMFVLLAITTTHKSNSVDISHKNAKQIMIMYASIIALLTLLISSNIINERDYERSDEMTELKADINAYISGEKELAFDNILSDIMDFLGFDNYLDKKSGGGMSDGKLGRVDKVEFTGEEVMEVSIESEADFADYYPLYIKYFVGSKYTGDSWTKMSNQDEKKIEEYLERYDLSYCELEELYVDVLKYSKAYIHTNDKVKSYMITLNMKDKEIKDNYWVYNTLLESEYEYDGQRTDLEKPFIKQEYLVYGYPSIADYKTVKKIYDKYGEYPYYDDNELTGSTKRDFEETLQILKEYEKVVDEVYTKIPETFKDIAVEFKTKIYEFEGKNVIMDRNLSDATEYMGYEPYIQYVQEYLSSRCKYTLSPGKLEKGEDFVNKFLLETKEGYCTHFASAGVLLFRSLGIPARYVTGYVVHEADAIGRYGKSISTVKDDAAHAWVEIYISGIGWRPVEVTPGNYREIIEEQISEKNTSEKETTTEKETTSQITTDEPKTTEEDITTTKGNGESVEETTTKIEQGSGEEEITTVFEEIIDEENDKKSKDVTDVIPYIIIAVVILVSIVGVLNYIIVRRHKKIGNIKKLLLTDKYNTICDVMVEQLLCVAGIIGEPVSIIDSVANTSKLIAKMCFGLDEKQCHNAAKIIYKHKYSNEDMSKEETEQLVNVVQNVTTNQYNNSNILRKTYMSYIKCLYLYKK